MEIGALVAKIETGPVAASAPIADKAVLENTASVAGHPSPAAAKIMRENDLLPSKNLTGTGRGRPNHQKRMQKRQQPNKKTTPSPPSDPKEVITSNSNTTVISNTLSRATRTEKNESNAPNNCQKFIGGQARFGDADYF